jgi:hypothetical protein
MRYAARLCTALAAITALAGCPESTKEGADLPTAGSARPAVELVVRTVNIKKNMTTRAADGKGDDDEWTAVDGKVYAIVTFDIAHNDCKAGEKIETSKAVLVAGGDKIQPVGGGPNLDKLCVQCQPSEALDCDTASRLRPYTIIFEVDEKADVSKTKLTYRDREVPLDVAKLSDSRANDAVGDEIEAKKAELTQLRKKLENTSNLANGKVIQSEMDRIRKEILVLEKKKK